MSHHHRFRVVALPLLVLPLFVALLAACSGDDGEQVTIYSGRSEDLIGPLLDDFSDQTGISVEVRYGSSAELALLIEEEDDKSPADVFLSQSPGAIGHLAENDLLAELPDELLEASLVSSEGSLWTGLSGRQRVLVYNTDMIDPSDLPTSVFDLTDSAYEGQVALSPDNGSFQDFLTAMRLELGDETATEWLEGMAANDSPSYANNDAIVAAVARGEVAMGLVNHYYAYRFLAEDPDAPIANHRFAPDDLGSLTIVTGVGVVRGGDEELGRQLIEFLLSDAAQQYFAEETFEYPLAEGVDPPVDLPPLEALNPGRIDELAGGLDRTLELIDSSGLR